MRNHLSGGDDQEAAINRGNVVGFLSAVVQIATALLAHRIVEALIVDPGTRPMIVCEGNVNRDSQCQDAQSISHITCSRHHGGNIRFRNIQIAMQNPMMHPT